MKFFVFAILVATACAARLEHLERSYLPPDNFGQVGNSFGPENNRFGISGHGSNSVSDGFVTNGGSSPFGSNGFDAPRGSNSNGLSRNSFEGATSNQYLPPNHGPSGSSTFGIPQFGSRNGASGSNGFGTLSGSSRFGFQPQISAASRQYLTPKYTPSQQALQEPFDENSGYIY